MSKTAITSPELAPPVGPFSQAIDVGEPGSDQVRLRQRRDSLEAAAKELFEVVASGKVRINVNQRFALKDAADAHKALEARATSGSTILTI